MPQIKDSELLAIRDGFCLSDGWFITGATVLVHTSVSLTSPAIWTPEAALDARRGAVIEQRLVRWCSRNNQLRAHSARKRATPAGKHHALAAPLISGNTPPLVSNKKTRGTVAGAPSVSGIGSLVRLLACPLQIISASRTMLQISSYSFHRKT